jgi:phage-related protein (TIGR01555 family)
MTRKARPSFSETNEDKQSRAWRSLADALGRESKSLTPIIEMPAVDPMTMMRPYQPAKGVCPDDAPALAMDDAFAWGGAGPASLSGLGNWANGLGFPGYAFLSELTQRPEYRRASEIIAKEMTRKWIKLKSTGTDGKDKSKRLRKLEDAMQRHRLQAVFREVTTLDGFFGLAHLYVDTGATDDPATLTLPLVVDKRTIKKGSLRGFRAIEPIWTSPNQYNASDPLNPAYYRPSTWFVMGKEIHYTRLMTFISRPVPDLLKPAYNFGGLSLSQLGIPYVNNWLRTRQSVSDITHAFSVPVFKTDMGNLTLAGAMQTILNRVLAFNRFRDNRGAFVIDKEKEDFAIASAPLGSLDKLQAQAQEHMASVWGIPLVVLLGITPSGLNASSDGEIRTFYAWIRAQQEQFYTDHLRRAINIIQLDEFGDIDPEIDFEYVSLWEMDDAAQATVQKAKADTHAVYLGDGVVSPEEVREAVARDPDSAYASLDLGDTPPPDPPAVDPETGEAVKPDIGGSPAKGIGETRTEERSGVGGDMALDKEWNEAGHPRGQPENAGEFAKSAGSSLSVSKGKTAGGVEAKREGNTWTAPGISSARIKALAIPPAWRDVRISHDEHAPLQVLGIDSKGRVQYRYTEAFANSKKAEKFERVIAFEKKAPLLNDSTKSAVSEGDETAAAVRLMLLTGMRPGSENDNGAEKKAHGATNLRKSHVQVDGDTVHYSFIGKEGVHIENKVKDKNLADLVSKRLNANDGERLFNTDETKARYFIKKVCGGDYKSKDLRTLKANALAAETIASMEPPADEKARRKAVNHVGDVVSSQLGNTRAMALSAYINPMLFDAWGLGMEKIAQDAEADGWASNERQQKALREFAEGVTYAGAAPKVADADDDDGND